MCWLETIKIKCELPGKLIQAVIDARDVAYALGLFMHLGVVEITSNGRKYVMLEKQDFLDWFGDNE